jgi:ATP-dependent protease ClpP protease subunit
VERKRVERREMGSKSVHVLVVWRSKEKREIDREMQGNGGGVMAGMAILHILICLKILVHTLGHVPRQGWDKT